MAITIDQKQMFEDLKEAVLGGAAEVLVCTDHRGDKVAVICAVEHELDGAWYRPLAQMFDGDPMQQLTPPSDEDLA